MNAVMLLVDATLQLCKTNRKYCYTIIRELIVLLISKRNVITCVK